MSKWLTATTGVIFLLSLMCGAQAQGGHKVDATDASTTDGAIRARAAPSAAPAQTSNGSFDRLAQFRREIEGRRQQRKIELEAVRELDKADREAWLSRWEEQRRQAREESIERERRQRRELRERSPALAAYRERHAEELERRRQSYEDERQARWQALDRLEY